MAAVNGVSNSFTNSYGITNKGLGGLLSGLDTDSLVEALTYSTRSKIATQGQQKQLLQWKQTAYRDVASTLRAFQSKRFSYTAPSSTNIASQSFFNTYVGQSTSGKVSLVSSKTSAIGTVVIDEIKQLATAEKITVNQKYGQSLSGSDVNLKNMNFTGKTLQIQVGSGTTKTIRLDSLNQYVDQIGQLDDTDPGYQSDLSDIIHNMQEQLQSLINTSVGTRSAAVIAKGNGIAGDPDEFDRYEDGAVQDANGKWVVNIVTANILKSGDLTNGDRFSVSLSALQDSVTVKSDCAQLGLTSGQTNAINKSAKLKDFFPDINNDTVSFKINGTLIELNMATDTVQSMMTKINSSAAGVTLSYNDRTKQFVFASKTSGAGEGIHMEDVKGRFLNSFVGAYGSNNMSSVDNFYNYGNSASITGTGGTLTSSDANTFMANNKGKLMAFSLTVNGKTENIYVNLVDGVDENGLWGGKLNAELYLESAVNEAIAEKFGSSVSEAVKFSIEASGVRFTSSSFYKNDVTLNAMSGGTGIVNFLQEAGIADGTTNIDQNPTAVTKLNTLGFDDPATCGGTVHFVIDGEDVDVTWDANDNIKDFVDRVNLAAETALRAANKLGATQTFELLSYSKGVIHMDAGKNAAGDARSLTFSDDPGGDPLMKKIFGTSDYDGDLDDSKRTISAGTNAEIVVDGLIITSETNGFTIDGIAFEINDVSTEKITLISKSDPDELVSKITEFIEEYNGILATLNKLIYETQEGNYPPLTDEQKAEMTEDQIKTWETEAKKGLLRNDQALSAIISEMRNAMMGKVGAAGISLADIGIKPESYMDNIGNSSSYDYTKAGRLVIDESALRNYIEKDPDAVRVLFTYSDKSTGAKPTDQGIAERLNAVVTKAANESSDSTKRGSLVRIAGTATSTGNNTSELGNKIDTIDKYITTLKTRLEAEYKRYWNKFSALETAIQRINSQSSWLSDFGS